jgi:dUTP pyrophosphatase
MSLLVKKLSSNAKLPTVTTPGEDLGFDLYALSEITLKPHQLDMVHTGISARYIENTDPDYHHRPKNLIEKILGVNGYTANFVWDSQYGLEFSPQPYGLLLRDRSSMAAKGINVSGGVIDAGYTGELKVLLTNNSTKTYTIHAGDKIVQMIPMPVKTDVNIIEVNELPKSTRSELGFGSSGE